jgi:hypothetical protein
MLSASKAQRPHYMAVLAAAAEYQEKQTEPLSFTFKFLALGVSSSATSRIVIDSVTRWQRHHQERTVLTEFLWTEYYDDLKTIAPLLLKISGDISQFEETNLRSKKVKAEQK